MSKKKMFILSLLILPLAIIIFGLGYFISYSIFESNEPTDNIELTANTNEREQKPRPAPVKKIKKPLSAEKMSELVNIERGKLALSPLMTSSLLNSAACQKLDHMLANDYWSHVSPDGVNPWYFYDLVGYAYINAGENLGYGFITERGMVTGWMDSSGHKANILGDYTEMGICSKRGDYQDVKDTTLVVNLFATPQ